MWTEEEGELVMMRLRGGGDEDLVCFAKKDGTEPNVRKREPAETLPEEGPILWLGSGGAPEGGVRKAGSGARHRRHAGRLGGRREVLRSLQLLKRRGDRRRFARQQKLIAGHGDEPRAVLDPFLRVGLGERQDARRLAGLLDARDGIGDSGLHIGMPGIARDGQSPLPGPAGR